MNSLTHDHPSFQDEECCGGGKSRSRHGGNDTGASQRNRGGLLGRRWGRMLAFVMIFSMVHFTAPQGSGQFNPNDPNWCAEQTQDNEMFQICASPSIGPMGGGTNVAVRGFFYIQGWNERCKIAKWKCQYGMSFTKGSATDRQCDMGTVMCPSPPVSAAQDQFLYVTGEFNNSGVITTESWPSYNRHPLIFKYFGIHFLTPISGVIEFNPNVQIQMLNAKAITSFKCRYIPYQPGWDPNTINALPGQISLVNDFSGVIRNVTYKIPADQDASLVRASRILCGVPDESLKLADGFDAAQLWIEVAEQETLNPQFVYTTNRQIFELFRPPNVTGASVLSSPYSGGTTVYVYGSGFRSYLGLSCQSLWCLNYVQSAGLATCKTTKFATAMYINSTTVRCTSGPYFAADIDCNTICGPGGPDAPYRRVNATTNPILRELNGITTIDCCGETCCSEVTRLQLALNGVDYIPTTIRTGVPEYTMLANAPNIEFTQYAVPKLFYVTPASGPLNGGLKIVITGNNLYPASKNFAKNFSFCRFGVYKEGGHSMEFAMTAVTYETPSTVSCLTPSSITDASSLLGLTLNGQLFQTSPNVMFSFFKVTLLEPFFGGFLGGTLMRASGPHINKVELSGRPGKKYQCRFTLPDVNFTASAAGFNNTNSTIIVPASFSAPDAIVCYTPSFTLGPSRVSISLSDDFFSEQLLTYNFVDEALVTTADPDIGPLSGGFQVMVSGSNFINSTLLACRFRSGSVDLVVSGADVHFVNNQTVSCKAPAVPFSGPTQVYVLNNGQQNSPTFAPFMYFEVLNVVPDGGLVEGGTDVRVTLSTDTASAFCKFSYSSFEYVVEGYPVDPSTGARYPVYDSSDVPIVLCNETVGNGTNNITVGQWGYVAPFEYTLKFNRTYVDAEYVNGTYIPQGEWINGSWVNGTWVESGWLNGTNYTWVNGSFLCYCNSTSSSLADQSCLGLPESFYCDRQLDNETHMYESYWQNASWENASLICFCNATSDALSSQSCASLDVNSFCSSAPNETYSTSVVWQDGFWTNASLVCYCNATQDVLSSQACAGLQVYSFCNESVASNGTYLTAISRHEGMWVNSTLVCYCNATLDTLSSEACAGLEVESYCNESIASNGTYSTKSSWQEGAWVNSTLVCYCNATSSEYSSQNCTGTERSKYCTGGNSAGYLSGLSYESNSTVQGVYSNGSLVCYCNSSNSADVNQSCAGTAADSFCNASDAAYEAVYSWQNGTWVEAVHLRTWVPGSWIHGVYSHDWVPEEAANGVYSQTWVPGTWISAVYGKTWQPGAWITGLHVNHTWVNGTWVEGYWAVNQSWQNGSYGPGYWVNQTYVPGYWTNIYEELPRGCIHTTKPAAPRPKSKLIECTTTPDMSPSIGGGAVTFSVSLNQRDFAVSPDFESFVFYPSPVINQLLPKSGPLRGGTGITAIGNNFFTLCKTGQNPITGVCYKCNEESGSTFIWKNTSSCKVTIPTVAPAPCGLPCRTGKDDRNAFGVAGTTYCKYGDVKVPARFMTTGRMKCFSPITPNSSAVVRVPMELSFNDQQYTSNAQLFHYYTITSLSPRSGPTYGDTIISIKGHNLFSGAQNGKQIQCQFWLDILQLGTYDEVNDVVTCPVPEQPAEMRDNGDKFIEVVVTLNFRIPDQFTLAQLQFEYYEEPLAISGSSAFGPMNGGGMPYELLLPLFDAAIPDNHHQSFPYKYPHFHSKVFLNSTDIGVEPTACFGVVTVSTNTKLVVPVTCCDDPSTEEPCDGSISRAEYVSTSLIKTSVPNFKSPSTVAVEISTNGWADGRINPDAQFTRQTYCTPKVFSCVQASAESRCENSIACGGIIFKYWGITSSFPISVSVDGGVPLTLFGNNFLHSEYQAAECIFYQDPTGTKSEFARVPAIPVELECDTCTARDEFGVCLTVRLCRAMECNVPAAPGLIPQTVTCELSFGPDYPITEQNTFLYYFTAGTVTHLDISGGPVQGGTIIGVHGTNFIDAPSVLCQFGAGALYTDSVLNSPSFYVSSELILCEVPPCNKQLMREDVSVCDTCNYCDITVRVTMNVRDFLPGAPIFSYRPLPDPSGIKPIRGPAAADIGNIVTISGKDFSPIGSGIFPVNGLSCKFGESIVPGMWHPTLCDPSNRTCDHMTCTPPRNNASVEVKVYVAIDGQQFVPVNKTTERILGVVTTTVFNSFGYFSATTASPPYALSDGGAVIRISGVLLGGGEGGGCKFITSNGTFYSAGRGIGSQVECVTPALPDGDHNVSVSLDHASYNFTQRDYSPPLVALFSYPTPVVTRIIPTRGYSTGGITVTVIGTGFWDSPLIQCKFGPDIAPSATFFNTTMVICSSPPSNETVPVDVSFNAQQFSNDSIQYVNYRRPVVESIFPQRIPADTTEYIVISGLYFKAFEMGIRCLFVSDSSTSLIVGVPWGPNLRQVRCQAPPGPAGSIHLVYVAIDGVQFSLARMPLYHYSVEGIYPFTGPTTGGTVITASGSFLGGEVQPTCQFIAQQDLHLEGTSNSSIYSAIVANDGGVGFTDGNYSLIMGECIDGADVVSDIEIVSVSGGFVPDGTFSLEVTCNPPCTGSGLVAEYTVSGEVVSGTRILNRGTGYSALNPPTVALRGCDGVGGAGICGGVVLQVNVGRSCSVAGCCSTPVSGTYSVFNGSVVSSIIDSGGSGFNPDFPPELTFNGCDGAGGGDACRSCQFGVSSPSGSCAATCMCSGSTPFCSDLSAVGTCACTPPNEGVPCIDSANCTGNGRCAYSSSFTVRAANVVEMPGVYTPDMTKVLCSMPPVTSPSSVEGFVQTQGTRTYTGMAKTMVKVSVHGTPGFTLESLLFRYHDPPFITNVDPDSASARGGSLITVTGALFKAEPRLTTLVLKSGSEDNLQDMELKCRLHNSLPSQPAVFVNSTMAFCTTNRVCFAGSTQSECQECIREGCAQPVKSYSHSLPTNTEFTPEISMNDQQFQSSATPFFVYSITSFRPFGGVYNGGTHVTIGGLNFDRGGKGPLGVNCRFSRIVVPGTYDPEFQAVKCIAGPLLDVDTVLEVHLGRNVDDLTYYTDDRQFFYYYTAFPGGLSVSPDTGSFRGSNPVSFVIPTPFRYNHFRFRSFDFHTVFERVECDLIVNGERDDANNVEEHLVIVSRILVAAMKSAIPRLDVPEGDVKMGVRTRINNTAFRVNVLVEPTEYTDDVRTAFLWILGNKTLDEGYNLQYLDNRVPIPLTFAAYSSPRVLGDYSEQASYARFGTEVTRASIYNLTRLDGRIAEQLYSSPSTVPVYFSVNGQQFSLQPVDFYYYTVAKVTPFGVPFINKWKVGENGVNRDPFEWTMCPEIPEIQTGACSNNGLGTITSTALRTATIRIYGVNFRSDLSQVNDPEFLKPVCRYGDPSDDIPGIIGKGLTNSDVTNTNLQLFVAGATTTTNMNLYYYTVPGTVNFDEGYVECPQPTALSFTEAPDGAEPIRRIRVEVALNGRDFSFSNLDPNGPMGLILYPEPIIYNTIDHNTPAWSTLVAPIDGGLPLIFNGEGFNALASLSDPPTCFCIFPTEGSIALSKAWQKIQCTVLNDNEVQCITPPYAANGYGFASDNFSPPPQFFRPAITLNDFHWHIPMNDEFSFFDVREITPTLSAITFEAGELNNRISIDTKNFLNPTNYIIFCWWKVPFSDFSTGNGFIVAGSQGGSANIFICDLPDWSSRTIMGYPAESLLPCGQSPVDFTDTEATCNLDGSLTVPFGVAFSATNDLSVLTEKHFALTKRFTFYATPRFYDFLPKMGDQTGGTEVNIYGENFLDLRQLQCRFSDGTQATVVDATYKSPNLITCISPVVRQQTEVTFYLTFNGVHWLKCSSEPNCVHMHPYYGEERPCCAWTDSTTKVQTLLQTFSYAQRPAITGIQPPAVPSSGDSNLQVIATNLAVGIKGVVYTCRIGTELVYGNLKNEGGLSYLTCLTRPNMKLGKHQVYVSVNEFEWSDESQPLDVYQPIHAYKVAPSFMIWDEPPATSLTIIGRNFIKQDVGIGGITVSFMEADPDGFVRWEKSNPPGNYGDKIAAVLEPSLDDGDTTDIITVVANSFRRAGCLAFGDKYCEAGISNVYVSQNNGFDWSWEKVPFAFILRPQDRTTCHLGCALLGAPIQVVAINGQLGWSVAPLDEGVLAPTNVRGICEIGTVDITGQAATTGFCTCDRPDCLRFIDPATGQVALKETESYGDWSRAVGAYDCGNLGGPTEVDPRNYQVELGCSIKAAITEVFPRSGPHAGGTLVQVRGFKFDKKCRNTQNPEYCPPADPLEGYMCKFGTLEVPATFNETSHLIMCHSPPLQLNGSVEVEISVSGGQEWTESHGYHKFYYYFPPTIMGLEPSIGPATGGTWIKLTSGFTDKLLALGTTYRSLDVDVYGAPRCSGVVAANGKCLSYYQYGSYSDFPMTSPGFEGACVWSPHCRYQLHQQHNLRCDFHSETADYWGIKLLSTDIDYILPTVIQCKTPEYPLLLNTTTLGLSFDDMVVRLTLNGQLWHTSPVNFRYHAFNNITDLFPRVGPNRGRIWVSLIGTGFVDTHLATCKFGQSYSLGFQYLNETYVRCMAPPSEVLQTVDVTISFNGIQFEKSLVQFSYVALWSMDKLEPEIGREIGGLTVSIKGVNFVESAALSCKFGDVIVSGEDANFESENYVTCKVPPRILPRPNYVVRQSSCDGATIDGSIREDNGWTVCHSITNPGQPCTECCDCPDCPECSPDCLCTGNAFLDGGAVCCQEDTLGNDFKHGLKFQQQCPPKGGAMLPETPRSLCLPPEYRCEWVSVDATTQGLQCTLLPFAGDVLNPPQPTVLASLTETSVLHPDLALRLTLPFYVSLDGQTWVSGCVSNPLFSDPRHVPAPCFTNDGSSVERWFGSFTYIEKYNVTKVRPEIAPSQGGTLITVIGEGFVDTVDIKCSFGYKSNGFFNPDQPRDPITDELIGVELSTSSGIFIDSFSVVCESPPLDIDVNPLVNTPFIIVPLELSINGRLAEYTTDNTPFAYSENWVVTRIRPSAVPSIGGEYITITGPYFRATEDIMCRFGDCPQGEPPENCPDVLYATEVVHLNDQTVICRTPSVEIHQRINVSITLDGQFWSVPTNVTEIEFFGVRNALTFGENEYGQLGFNVVRERISTGRNCYGGTLHGFECEDSEDCPAGQCLLLTRNLNYWPTFLKDLFAHNISGISMGQTHTLLISSETYNDTKGTFPRRGLVYGWGDNLVGQIGLGFAGPSPFNYNISSPAVLICPTEEVYLFDRRVDERPIVGLPLTWPNTDWIVPTCIVNQDVKGVLNGEWEVNTFVQYNPFMYENVVQVVSGSFHSLAVTDKGDLYAWGWNTDNQLGQGPVETRASIPYPTAVFFFRRKINANVVRLAAGFAHSAAVTEDGDLYTWGNNKYGQLGTGDYNTRSFPTLVKGFVDSSGAVYKVGDIACGLYHCLALTTTGQVWSFGSNSRGQLGTCAGPVTRTESLDLTCELTPVMNNAVFNTQPIPVLVDFLDITDYNGNVIGQPYVSKIACGAFHSMAIGSPCITALSEGTTQCPQFDLAEGDLYVWGHNRFGQLGTGVASEFTFQQTPTLVMAFQTAGTRCRREENADLTGCVPPQDFFRMGKRVTNVDAGSWHTLVFVEQKEQIGYRRQFVSVNRFFTFGNNEEGQLGHGDTLDRNYPTMVPTNYVKLHDLSGSFYQSMYTQGCLPSDWNPCQGNGLCFEQGVCECSSGYRGVDCSIVCDGGADSPCSGHGDPDMAKKIAAWRQDVINVTAGWKLLGFYEKLFEEWVCDADVKAHNDAISADPPIPIPKSRPQVFYGSVPGENSTNLLTRKPILPVPTFYHQKHCEDHCVPLQGKCTMRKKMNASSEDVLHMLELINASSTLGSLKTATRMIIEDWPITLFNQGLRSPHLYSYNARSEVLTPKTYGPRQGGVWWPSDILPMLEMFQNRSTCWRTYSCGSPFTPCEIIRGSVRITQGESALDVLQGCRDGWTARVHFQKRIEEIDQAWSNLEMENYQCDPQAVADEVGIRKEQVQFIWAVFERDVGNITRMLAEDFILEDPLSTPMNDPENQIPAVWKALSEGCQNTSIGQVKSGCMFDGSCMCAKGWTGPACDIMCAGGVDNPCSGNGVCRFDGLCECRRGWTGKDCSIECSGAAEDPLHFPCNNNGMCEGWYVDARTQYEYAPTDYEQAVYMSTGRGLSFYNLSTALATTGECTCHYGYRSDWGMSDCGVQCPGTAERYLDERGECYNNGVCNVTGKCECFEGYRNVSCNVECLGGHKIELGTGTVYSNECTSRPICDVYPQYSITTSDQRQVLCSEMDKFADDYSKDYSKVASGVTLRVYNGLCQYLDFTPPTVDRQFPVPKCPNDVWCDPTLPVAGPGGDCSTDSAVQTYCLEHKTRFMNFTGQYFNSTRENPGILDPLVGDPPSGCPDKQCKGIADYIEKMGYNQQEALRFAWAGPQPDRAPHHSVTMGHCYCLSGFRGANCSKTCPGAEMDPFNPTGDDRSFPVSFENTMWPRSEPGYPYPPLPGQMVHVDQVREGDPNSPLSMAIYGLDVPRGWDANNDNITEGVAARSLINICSARGYCEEDATCSCFLTDRGPHTNWTDVTGYRGEACEIECPGGAHSICSKNGICNENGECICFKGYRNDTCEVQCEGARDCDPARGCAGVCNYAGECGVEGICTCDATFKGPGCGKVCPPWTGKPQDECFGRGVCRYDEELDDAVCDCSIFYEGEACERIAGWVIFVLVFAILIFIAVCVHVIRRYLHSRMRQKRRARRDRRKVRRTQAAVGRLKNYKVTMPDAAALEAKGL